VVVRPASVELVRALAS